MNIKDEKMKFEVNGKEIELYLFEADKREAFTKHDVWLMLSKYGAPTILEAEE